VRVLSVDSSKRLIEFTKKDTLMKEDCPVFKSFKEVKKGDKVYCVVVSTCEHGLVVKSFGDIKGLVTFEDIKQKDKNFDESQYKVGTVLKAYCLFKKRDKGLALTLSKKKVKDAQTTEKEGELESIENSFLPSEHALETLLAESRFSTMVKSG
jgi:ribosomal protein S1